MNLESYPLNDNRDAFREAFDEVRRALGMPGESLDVVCERVRTLLQTEMSAQYLFRAFLDNDSDSGEEATMRTGVRRSLEIRSSS